MFGRNRFTKSHNVVLGFAVSEVNWIEKCLLIKTLDMVDAVFSGYHKKMAEIPLLDLVLTIRF
jgi:hypothetical protein